MGYYVAMCFLSESSLKSIKHKIAFFTSAICFEINQRGCWGESEEQNGDAERLAMRQYLLKLGIGSMRFIILSSLFLCMSQTFPNELGTQLLQLYLPSSPNNTRS